MTWCKRGLDAGTAPLFCLEPPRPAVPRWELINVVFSRLCGVRACRGLCLRNCCQCVIDHLLTHERAIRFDLRFCLLFSRCYLCYVSCQGDWLCIAVCVKVFFFHSGVFSFLCPPCLVSTQCNVAIALQLSVLPSWRTGLLPPPPNSQAFNKWQCIPFERTISVWRDMSEKKMLDISRRSCTPLLKC